MFNFVNKDKKSNNLEDTKGKSFYEKLRQGLTRTRDNIKSKLDNIITIGRKLDDEVFDELEEVLILADIGVTTTETIIENIKEKSKERKIKNALEIKNLLVEEIYNIMIKDDKPLDLSRPTIFLIVGVNGVGKTTTIGKLAYRLKDRGKKVLLVAADTFRAAAIEQLGIWANKTHCEMIKHEEGSDPASVIYDGLQAADARGYDIVLCDTAGRLHNKKNLMEELKKIYNVAQRESNNWDIQVLLVLDATTGQNAVQQAKIFKEMVNVTGIVLTKLDGTAKGGIAVAIKSELNIPVRFIGIGEGIDDLQSFNPENYVKAFFE